eukprot:13634-Heterococcus_DN1.PRE.3
MLVTTLYDVLNAKPQDDAKKLKAAFRKLALAKHPDKLGPFKDDEAKEAANAAFVRIMRAWETLSDPDKRSACNTKPRADIIAEIMMREVRLAKRTKLQLMGLFDRHRMYDSTTMYMHTASTLSSLAWCEYLHLTLYALLLAYTVSMQQHVVTAIRSVAVRCKNHGAAELPAAFAYYTVLLHLDAHHIAHCMQSYDYAAAAAAAAAVRYEEEPFHLAALFKRGAFTLRYSGSGRSSAPDVVVLLNLDLEQCLTDHIANVTVTRQVLCPMCHGTGHSGAADTMPVCPVCGGAKRAWHLYDAADDADEGNANFNNVFHSSVLLQELR